MLFPSALFSWCNLSTSVLRSPEKSLSARNWLVFNRASNLGDKNKYFAGTVFNLIDRLVPNLLINPPLLLRTLSSSILRFSGTAFWFTECPYFVTPRLDDSVPVSLYIYRPLCSKSEELGACLWICIEPLLNSVTINTVRFTLSESQSSHTWKLWRGMLLARLTSVTLLINLIWRGDCYQE